MAIKGTYDEDGLYVPSALEERLDKIVTNVPDPERRREEFAQDVRRALYLQGAHDVIRWLVREGALTGGDASFTRRTFEAFVASHD